MPRKSGCLKLDNAASATLLAAVSDGYYVITSIALVCDSAVTVKFQSGSTDLTGAMSFAANGGMSTGYNPEGFLKGAKNEAFKIALGGSVGVRGFLTYELVQL